MNPLLLIKGITTLLKGARELTKSKKSHVDNVKTLSTQVSLGIGFAGVAGMLDGLPKTGNETVDAYAHWALFIISFLTYILRKPTNEV